MLEQYKDVLDVDDLCNILRVSRNSTYGLLRTGQIGSFRIGRTWKIPKIALEAYLTRNSKGIS